MEIVAIVAVIIVVVSIVIYNGVIGKKNAVENSFASIDVQLKQRHDLIPNLVASVKAYMTHEQGTLEKLVTLRTQAIAPGLKPNQAVDLENQISKCLSGVLVAVENYPQLKANENVTNLQHSLNEVEAQIAAARRAYNSAVTEYNNALEMFPSSIFAKMLGYQRQSVFAAEATEKQNPDVSKIFKA